MTLCRRKTDGAMFRPSFPDGYDGWQATTSTLNRKEFFYFRMVKWQPRRWWQIRGRWVDTGEIWEPTSGEFDVIKNAEAVYGETALSRN